MCSWVTCARFKREKLRKEVVVRFQICAILVCLRRVSQPWTFASSWFRGLIWDLFCFFVNCTNFLGKSTLFFSELSYIIQRHQGSILTAPGFFATPDVQMAYSIVLLLAQILKMKLLNEMSRPWHKRSETSHSLNQN